MELFIYRHQDFQNAGLGTMLMRKAIELAKKAGLHSIGLSVVADNHRTIKVYQKGRLQEGRNHERVFYGNDHRYHVEVEMGRLLQ